jgi:hypothetical membrane protein
VLCPACNHCVTLGESLRILNPFNFGCPSCKVRLRVGPRGRALTIASAIFGLLLAGIAIYMEETERWQARNSLTFFVLTFGILGVPWQYFAIRFSDAQVRRDSGAA